MKRYVYSSQTFIDKEGVRAILSEYNMHPSSIRFDRGELKFCMWFQSPAYGGRAQKFGVENYESLAMHMGYESYEDFQHTYALWEAVEQLADELSDRIEESYPNYHVARQYGGSVITSRSGNENRELIMFVEPIH